MNCPRCGTDLPDSATFCHKCGSSFPATSFSYLPEGTPAWPTKVPQNFSYTAGMIGASSPLAHTANGQASLSAQSVQQREGENFPATGRQTRPQRSARSFLLIVGVLLLSALI